MVFSGCSEAPPRWATGMGPYHSRKGQVWWRPGGVTVSPNPIGVERGACSEGQGHSAAARRAGAPIYRSPATPSSSLPVIDRGPAARVIGVAKAEDDSQRLAGDGRSADRIPSTGAELDRAGRKR